MTTARERAREAAVALTQGWGPAEESWAEPHADAASDVWEPLLREAYSLLYRAFDIVDADPDSASSETPYGRIKIALGEFE